MDRCATLGRSDLAKFAWVVLGAVVGCSLAKRCKGMFLFYVGSRGLGWNRVRSIGSSAQGLLHVEGCIPVVVPEDKMLAASDFFNRINWGLTRGRFVMDPSDGEVRFHQEFGYGSVSNSGGIAVLYMVNGARMVDAVFPALTGVFFATPLQRRHLNRELRSTSSFPRKIRKIAAR